MKRILSLLILILLTAIHFSCKTPLVKKHEIRAVWMSRFEYAQDKTAEESKQYIQDSFRKFAGAGFNLVIFQVRGNADAFYQSDHEPWSKLLTGSLGKDPGWDPLEFALQTAHQYGLELHAWLNTFPAWRANEPPPDLTSPPHPYLIHPEWVVCDSLGKPMQPRDGYISFSPGIPAVHDHLRNVVLDIIRKYDVDGIHFDYIRYPESSSQNGYSHDSVSVERFSSPEINPDQYSFTVFQREQVSSFVTMIYNAITAEKPWVKVSAAVLGHHHGAPWNGFSAVYQDAQRWLATGKIDLLFPMTYTRIKHPTASYESSLQQWKEMFYTCRPIVPGIAIYKLGEEYDLKQIWAQMNLIREQGFPGMVFFSAENLSRALEKIHKKYYPVKSLIPPLPWKTEIPPVIPLVFTATVAQDSLLLQWQTNTPAHHVVIYHTPEIEKASNILAILPGTVSAIKIKREFPAEELYITALNRVNVESSAIKCNVQPVF